MDQLAKDLQLSRTTVSLVLNNKSEQYRITPETRRRVLAQADVLGFRKNLQAASLATGKTGTVGVILPNILGTYYHQALNGVQKALGDTEVVVMGASNYDVQAEEKLMVSLLERRVDGLIMVYIGNKCNQHLLHEIRKKRMPLVLLDRHWRPVDTNYVTSDNRNAGLLAATQLQHYAGKSAKYFFISSDLRTNSSTRERFEGFKKAMTQGHAGMDMEVVKPRVLGATSSRQCGRMGLDWIIQEKHQTPIAVFANNSAAAVGVLESASEHGLKLPEQLTLCHMDQIDLCGLFTVPTISIVQDAHRMGEAAGQILLEEISAEKSSNTFRHVRIGVTVISSLKAGGGTRS